MRVHVGGDHASFELKNYLVAHLRGAGHDVVDHGSHVYDDQDDYPVYVLPAAAAVAAEPGSLGLVLGGSGNGEQIAANRVSGIRAALAWSVETATLARAHNDAQVVAIGARMHTPEQAAEILDAFVATAFSGAQRHQRRLDMLAAYSSTGDLPVEPGSSGTPAG